MMHQIDTCYITIMPFDLKCRFIYINYPLSFLLLSPYQTLVSSVSVILRHISHGLGPGTLTRGCKGMKTGQTQVQESWDQVEGGFCCHCHQKPQHRGRSLLISVGEGLYERLFMLFLTHLNQHTLPRPR